MAVTKQVYTLSPTWTASGLADLFRSAFIDAGLMTDWYDSFLSGSVENRILEVVNDGTKTYGTVYYWFMFTTNTVGVHTALDWNATGHVPAGTVYLDYYSTTTNSTTNHDIFASTLATGTSLTLTRYTSAINTSCTWFVCRQSSTFFRFLIPFGSYTATSFVDQNTAAFNGIVLPSSSNTNYYGVISFLHHAAHTRRTYLGAAYLNNTTTSSQFRFYHTLLKYSGFGNVSTGGSSNFDVNQAVTWLPVAMANTNTALAADHTPVYTSILCSPYLPVLPADFAMTAYYASTAITTGDTLVVTASSEEYEVVTTAGATVNTAGSATTALLARTV